MTIAPARIEVYWQPGCSSCLRTKEFLTKQGIEYESIDVHNDPDGLARLEALGAQSVPVVALAGKYTLCQSIDDVIKFLELPVRSAEPLPPAELVARIDLVLSSVIRYVQQFPVKGLHEEFRNRKRTPAQLAFHIFRLTEMGMQAAEQIPLAFEGFNEVPPPEWTATELAAFGEDVRGRFAAWWAGETDGALTYDVPTYYGRRSCHEVIERTAWHGAQHTRQLMLMLESHGVSPDRPLTPEDLAGLPLPDAVWG